ncbi:hypothetical protein M8J77_019203 [Diaphorina citri]|nr:hypothetical protein M8J77_019203 [Diaphorina citri]
MKYLQVVPAPSPIESWLHTQLEARGVDRVYSRYILSLFHSTDVGDHDFLDLDIPSKELKRLNKKSSSHHYHSRHHTRGVDSHKLIRASVIETLRSVSETKAGIETLVDELCDRIHSNEKSTSVPSNETRYHSNDEKDATLPAAQSLNNVSVESGLVDLAQKYYDAFPALGSNPQHPSSAALLLACCTTSPWNGKHRSLLSSQNLPLKEEKIKNSPVTPSDEKSEKLSGQEEVKDSLLAKSSGEDKHQDKENQQDNQDVKSADVKPADVKSASDVSKMMEPSLSVKRKLFVEVEEPKDSLASLMEKVDGTKDLWEGTERWAPDPAHSLPSLPGLTSSLPPRSLAPLSTSSAGLNTYLPARSSLAPLSTLSTSSAGLTFSLPPRSLIAPLSTSSTGSSGFIPCGTNLTTSIWSEVDYTGGWSVGGSSEEGGDDSGVCLGSPTPVSVEEETQTALSTLRGIQSLLNHSPETSAFQPVVRGSRPGPSSFPSQSLLVLSQPSVPGEENLLTSARTHFCPIDKVPHYKAGGGEGERYANGTTFSIASTLDEIEYQVGVDGTLNWDSGVYMEFKANGLNTECYNLCDPFKPKFRVHARDKGVQTEPLGLEECKGQQRRVSVGCGDRLEDFYFPGEESIARDIMRSLEEAEDPATQHTSLSLPSPDDDPQPPCSKRPCSPLSPLLLDAWAVAWPPFSIWSNTGTRAGDGWPTPSHDYGELSKPGWGDTLGSGEIPTTAPAGLYTNYSVWAPPIFPLDTNSNVILCTKAETPLPLGVNMGNLKISSDRKRRHSASQFLGALSTFPCIKSEVSFFQQSITL